MSVGDALAAQIEQATAEVDRLSRLIHKKAKDRKRVRRKLRVVYLERAELRQRAEQGDGEAEDERDRLRAELNRLLLRNRCLSSDLYELEHDRSAAVARRRALRELRG